jgi:anti-sigma factor RsiW
MNCKKAHKKIIFYLEGSLPEKVMKEVRDHLHKCSACHSFAKDLEATLSVIEKERHPEVNPYLYTRAKARMENRRQEKLRRNPGVRRILQPALFTLLLLVGIYTGIKIGQLPFNDSQVKTMEEEMVPYLNEMESEPIESFLME